MAKQPFVRMENIRKSYGHVEALKGVDFDVMHNEIVGLVGDNAAGKSTLIKVLSGAIKADSGKIFLNGDEQKITNPADSRNLGIETVYQTFALVDNLPIYSNIFLGRLLTKKILGFLPLLNKNSMIKNTWEVLKLTEINFDSVKRRVSDLSGGQRQAVAIARSMFFNPRLLILDEPTAGLAVKELKIIEDTILNLKSKGISIIFISHRLESIFRTATRIVVLRSGKKVMDKESKNLTMKEVVEKMFGLE
ncbi:MAG: ATP-binding cassette domain-containing protein [bacterium]